MRLPAGIARRGYIVREQNGDPHATWSASNPDHPQRQPGLGPRMLGWVPWGNDEDPAQGEVSAKRWLDRMRRAGYKRAYVEVIDEYEDGRPAHIYRWQHGAGELEERTDAEQLTERATA